MFNQIVMVAMMRRMTNMVSSVFLQTDLSKLKQINAKWRELDHLQIELHSDCMSTRKWATLNCLNAIGLELTKDQYPAIGSYIEEKMSVIQRALADLRHDGEIIG